LAILGRAPCGQKKIGCGRSFPATVELTVHCCTAGRQPDYITIDARIEGQQRESITSRKVRTISADCCPFLLTPRTRQATEMHIAKATVTTKLNAFECF